MEEEKVFVCACTTQQRKYGSYGLDLFPYPLARYVIFVLNDLSCGFVPLFSKCLFWWGANPALNSNQK
jgi:hypothetical protein